MPETFDVVVIGGGTAGLVTASGCARLGRRVALIERDALGGDCLWTGCVPTKALVASARLAHQMRHASVYGLTPVTPQISPAAVMQSMREQRLRISAHDDPDRFRALGIDVVHGAAHFISPHEVEVAGRRLLASDIVIATGARTAVPPVEGLAETGFVDHVSFLAGDAFPASVLVLGGGYIGIEFAQILSRFGSRVTVVEMADEIIAREDPDMIVRVRGLLTSEGIELTTGWTVKSVRREAGRKVATIRNPAGESREITADEIFVASGRRGNIEGLKLDAAGVELDRTWVRVDRFLQTTTPRIWAIGDIHGGLQFTHVAAYEAVKLVRNMLFPGKSAVDYRDVPWTLYTDPELAHIGLTEPEARAKHGDSIRVYKTELADVDRAIVDRASAGLLKIICDSRGTILGAHALCTHASTVIQEIVLARRKGMKITELAQRISSYPSLADGVQKTASLYYADMAKGWLGAAGRRIAGWSQ
jgi:pyruvate/2-oxoglutarate dehydrogenase complex dihydrolipoamide dehydrogenase (E3) component